MKHIFLVFLAVICITQCVSDRRKPVTIKVAYHPPVSNAFAAYETSFGSAQTGTKPEFQLWYPPLYLNSIAVTDSDYILIFDDGRIKVFNPAERRDGTEKTIVGRPGIQPESFSRNGGRMDVSPSGYITVMSETYRRNSEVYYFCSIIDPNYTFIDKIRFTDTPMFKKFKESQSIRRLYYSNDRIKEVFHLNDSERIFSIYRLLQGKEYEGFKKYQVFIYYENVNQNKILAKTECTEALDVYSTISGIGYFGWGLLPDRRIVYITTDEDVHRTSDRKIESYYTIHIKSIDTETETTITRPYEAVEYPDSMGVQYFSGSSRKNSPQTFTKVLQIFKQRRFYPSVFDVKTEGNYVFIYLTQGKNTLQTIKADVLDAKTGQFVSSVQFPAPFKAIKNGYAYDIAPNTMGFFEIRKYRLSPSVYGK